MGFMIGDVLGLVATILAIGFSAWAFMVAAGLLFPDKTRYAGTMIRSRFWSSFFIGLGGIVVCILPVVILLNLPATRLFGYWLICMIACTASFGGAGIAQLLSERIREGHAEMTPYAGLVKGAGFLSALAMSPLVGWFFLTPMFLIIGFGAGLRAAFRRTPIAAPSAPQVHEHLTA